MAEYVEREKARAMTDRHKQEHDCGYDCTMEFAIGWSQALDAVSDDIEEMPAADVRPERHGRWVSWEEAGNFIPSPDRYECSVCHDAAQVLCNGVDLLSSYCPNCGAKMDLNGGESDDN